MLAWCTTHYYLTAIIAVFLIHLVEVIAYGIKELIERRMRMKLALKLIADGRMTIAEIIRELKR
jgi:hypothetical protein